MISPCPESGRCTTSAGHSDDPLATRPALGLKPLSVGEATIANNASLLKRWLRQHWLRFQLPASPRPVDSPIVASPRIDARGPSAGLVKLVVQLFRRADKDPVATPFAKLLSA
jgi:hypothetical protein